MESPAAMVASGANPMTNQRTFLDALAGLLALSALLAPNAMALGIDDVEPLGKAVDDTGLGAVLDAACSGEGTVENVRGRLAISGLGTFDLWIQSAENGCGGGGCDDSFTGTFTSNGQSDRYVAMTEGQRRDSSGACEVFCAFKGAFNEYNTPYPTIDTGHIRVDVAAQEVDFSCNSTSEGRWVFSGWADKDGS